MKAAAHIEAFEAKLAEVEVPEMSLTSGELFAADRREETT